MDNEKKLDGGLGEYTRKIIDSMPGGFFIYCADGDEELLYVNQAMLRIFLCDTEEEFRKLTGNSFRGIVHPDDLEAVEESIKEQISQNRYDLDYVEYRIIRKDGIVRWIEDYGHFVRSEIGDIFYVFVGDATEKKVRQMRAIAGLSIDYASIFSVDLDANRVQTYRINQRLKGHRVIGTQIADFRKRAQEYINELVHPDDREMLSQAMNSEYIRARLAKEKSYSINYRLIDRENDGKIEHWQLRVVNVGEDNHRVSCVVMGYRSIEEEISQELEQRRILEEALAQAKSANLAKSAFLANMSHDIRTPMNAIIGFNTLAKTHIDDREKLIGYLDGVAASSDQLLHLLNDVLEISSMEDGRTHVNETACTIPDIVKEALREMLPKAAHKDIKITLDLSGMHHCDIYCDAQKLTSIIVRLTSNAVKYTPVGGMVKVSVTEKEQPSENYGAYQFVVEDNGMGISPEFQKHLFEPFERERNSTLSGVQGTGLGLTIIRNMVELMGGEIEAQSREGEGSRFVVTLHFRLQNDRTQRLIQDEDISAGPRLKPQILLVEDNEINREIMAELLVNSGFLVDTAQNGAEAVEKLQQSGAGKYALVLMDIQMPVMDGYTASRTIRRLPDADRANIPIVALSANAFEEDKRQSMESGMNAHLEKPVDLNKLLKLIDVLLGNNPAAL